MVMMMTQPRPHYTCVLLAPRQSVSVRHRQVLLGLILRSGRLIGHSCKGLGTCGACIVRVKGSLSEMTTRERMTLEARHAYPDERLACLAKAMGDLEVWAPSWGSED